MIYEIRTSNSHILSIAEIPQGLKHLVSSHFNSTDSSGFDISRFPYRNEISKAKGFTHKPRSLCELRFAIIELVV
jgi:hypothetical protein